MADLTHDRLRYLLTYDPATGDFTWNVDRGGGRYKAGEIAGTNLKRYRQLWIDGQKYSAHRIAFFWMEERWPDPGVDHENLNGFDNRWANLREATHSQNCMNKRGWASSGVKGVYFTKDRRKCGSKPWKASIAKDGKTHRLGTFRTLEEARAAHDAAALRLHGEFARFA